MENRRFNIWVHPDIPKYFIKSKKTFKEWVSEEAPKYQDLPQKPLWNYEKVRFQPRVTGETKELLKSVPGKSYGIKVSRLYFDMIHRAEKRQRREYILNKLFK